MELFKTGYLGRGMTGRVHHALQADTFDRPSIINLKKERNKMDSLIRF